jgi:hypothetical protein
MALRGNLKDFSLPDVFQLVTFSRKTGVLRIVRHDQVEGSVWFREGEVFFASSNWHSDPLGLRLVNAQRITPQALNKALEIRRREGAEGRRLGQILIDEGYITDEVLEAFVSEQIQDTIFDLMRWDDGDFDFEAMPEVVDEDIGLTVSIENVVMEGSRRLEEWSRIKKKIPSTDVVFKMATAPGEGTFEISLKPIEWQSLLLIDGTRSIADLAIETRRTDFEVARIVYGLFSAGLLEFATEDEIKRNRAERDKREAKLAVIEAEKDRDEQAKQAATAPALEAERVEDPEFLAGGASAPTLEDQAALDEFMGAVLSVPSEARTSQAPVESQEPATPYVPAEEPAFIAIGRAVPAEDHLDSVPTVEELLGIHPVSAGHEAEELEPEFEPEPEPDLVLELEPEPESQPEPVAAEPLKVDFERELRALGLGELPSDLLEPMGGAAPVVPAAEPVVDAETESERPGFGEITELPGLLDAPALEIPEPEVEPPVAEPMSEIPAWVEDSPPIEAQEAEEPTLVFESAEPDPEVLSEAAALAGTPEEAMDFSALIESLDIDADDTESRAVKSGFDEDLLRDEANALAGGVISTDAYLEDIGIEELDFSGGLTDELSALTGAQRRTSQRPQASVKPIPEGRSGVLHRDARVDKETLLKIIDGIKKL